MKTQARKARLLGATLLTGLLAACADAGPTALDAPAALADGVLLRQEVELCKTGPEGSSATFSISATGGVLLHGSEVTITDVLPYGSCLVVWQSNSADAVSLTIVETAGSPGTVLNDIVVFNQSFTTDIATATATLSVSDTQGGLVIFKNVPVDIPPPPPGIHGCTPGFWKQSQHFQFWTGYTTGQTWGSVFADPGTHYANKGQSLNSNTSLLGALNLGGGGILALARHGVAALLNSSSESVDYPYTTAQVIAMVNGAIESGDYLTAQAQLAQFNELGCSAKD